MIQENELNKHKDIINIFLKILPFALPISKRKMFFINESNPLNSLISGLVGKYYILDLSEKNDQYQNDKLYENICEAYDYILNVVDNTSTKYDENKIVLIKKTLGID